MPYAQHGEAKIYYEKMGQGFPVVAIAPGGLRSSIDFWRKVEWDPAAFLSEDFSVILLDLPTAGKSSITITDSDGWDTLESAVIAVLDDVGADKAHCMGMCIGGALVIDLLVHYPQRFVSAVPLQPIGFNDNLALFQQSWSEWAQEYIAQHPQEDAAVIEKFTHTLLSHPEFLFTGVTPEQVSQIDKPVLILEGNDEAHPKKISHELKELIPNAQLLPSWKTYKNAAQKRVKRFLVDNTPAS